MRLPGTYISPAESGLYYLGSRYYDPEVGRFINEDACYDNGSGILRHNMFAYCGNNPIVRVDPDGESWILTGLIMIGVLLLSGCSAATETIDKSERPKSNIEPYSSYGNGRGNVYIVNKDKVAEVENSKNDKDVIIVDYRYGDDPNMQVKQSYKIIGKKYKEEIAQIMIDYNYENPVTPAWNRTVESIVGEWFIHNIACIAGYKPERTIDTDFNNNDEGKGFWDFVWR